MKKYFNFMLFTLVALLFTGCSNEEEINGSTNKSDPSGKIAFSFPMNKEGVTYAGTLEDGDVTIANPNESVVKAVHIYMFENEGSKLLKDWQAFTEVDMSANAGKAFFDVTDLTGTYTFYAVANIDFHVPAASLTALVKGTSTLADFQKIISNNTGSTQLKATATEGLLMTGYKDVADVTAPTADEKKIALKRRVARFDVQNQELDKVLGDETGTSFKISAIYISNANVAGHLTAEASTGTLPAPAKLDALTYAGTNDGELNKSVFYLWPTTLDKSQAKTVISIEGTLSGVKQIYQVKPTADLPILGNYRYILKVKRVATNKIDFEIIVDEWNEGGDINGEQNKTKTSWSTLTNSTVATGGVFDATLDGTTVNYNGSDATGTAVLKISSSSYRSGATNYTVTGTEGVGMDIVVTKNETITYGGAVYTTEYTITIPQQSVSVSKKITIADVDDSDNKKEILIEYIEPKSTTWSPLTNPTVGTGGVFNATLNGTTVNYNGSDATGTAELEITASSKNSGATDYTVSKLNGTDSAGTNITVTKSETLTGQTFNTVYKITIPKQSLPVDRKITISDKEDANNKKEIIIKAIPNYENAAYKPVLVNGIYWAPVNVGATNTTISETPSLESTGYLYQWGRNKGFVFGATGDTVSGPVSLADATTGQYKDKFMKGTDNWLNVDGTITTQVEADALWSGDNAQGPCPAGWRIPTSAELAQLQSVWTEKLSFYEATGTDGIKLYMPAGGYRSAITGASFTSVSYCYFWSSTSADNNLAFALKKRTGGMSDEKRNNAYSVRCVQK